MAPPEGAAAGVLLNATKAKRESPDTILIINPRPVFILFSVLLTGGRALSSRY
jgi:hypothetical protein